MRLLSLKIRNYRIHGELSFEFDPARNLVGGPNGSGKSTLAEAAHRVLFLKAKTGGAVQEEMESKLHHGSPEVELSFETGGERWTIEKKFSGSRGSARLQGPAGVVLKDDEAEVKLSALLKSEVVGGRGAAGQLSVLWSHLWVWQGRAGEDPGSHAKAHREALILRLQKEGVGGMMQSATDALVRDKIAAAYEELFASSGKLRKVSSAEQAAKQHEEAESSLRHAEDALQRLEAAVNEHETAALEIKEAKRLLPNLRKQFADAESKAVEVTRLRSEVSRMEGEARQLEERSKELVVHDRSIRQLQADAAAARESLKPAEERETAAATGVQRAKEACRDAEAQLREASDGVRQARLRHDLAAAFVLVFEKDEAWLGFEERASELGQLGELRAKLLEQLSRLPQLSQQDLSRLRELDRAALQASAKLEAMSTGIRILRAPQGVILDHKAVAEGESVVLSDAAELEVGETKLLITPGGGSSLAAARRSDSDARDALAKELQRHALEGVEQAAGVLARRQDLELQLKAQDARWKSLGGDAIRGQLAAATVAKDAARADLDRRRAVLPSGDLPCDPVSLAEAREALSAVASELEGRGKNEDAARRQEERLRREWESADQFFQQQREVLAGMRKDLDTLDTRIQVMEEARGNGSVREAAIALARTEADDAVGKLEVARKALGALSPDLVEVDLQRLKRAIHQQEDRLREAEIRGASAHTRLQLDGSADPEAELDHARARFAMARETRDLEHRRARAIEKLHRLFGESRAAIDRALVQPLVERVTRYLECIFGPGTAAVMALSEEGLSQLELARPGDPAFSFQTLSGGEKEQVAAAVRLALAEVLAVDHGGCLPLVFDDAFAYSDPHRLQALQRMLDLAASRGLQIIVLSCNPSDFAALGAAGIRLPFQSS